MYHNYSSTKTFKSSAKTIYKIYSDVEHWKIWDTEIEYSKLNGRFANNSTGVLKPKGSGELQFKLQNVKENVGFEQTMKLPFGSKFILTRTIKPLANTCEVTHSGYFEGFFGRIIGYFLKLKYTPLLTLSLVKLKDLCEKE